MISDTIKDKFTYENLLRLCTWGLVLFFTGLYISLIFNHNIWTDEAYTLEVLRLDMADVIPEIVRDTSPPFYYLYAKMFYLIFGDALIVQKIAAIIPMVITLIIGATAVKKCFGAEASYLFVLFLSCVPCSMEFAVQVRMYTIALLFVTICGLSAYRAYEEGKTRHFVIFAVSGVLSAYTHYFAFVAAAVIAAMLLGALLMLKRKYFIRGAISVVGMAVGYLPWLPAMISQMAESGSASWSPEISAEAIWGYSIWAFGLDNFSWVVFAFLIILKIISVSNIASLAKEKRTENIFTLCCMLVPTLTLIGGLLISVWKTPIYQDRYIFPTFGILALFFAIGMRNARKYIVILISAFLLFVGAVQYKECFHQEYRSTLVPQTEAFFNEHLSEDDFVVYNWEAFGFIYECYFPLEQMAYLEEFDFGSDFSNVWFLDTSWMPDIAQDTLEDYGLAMEFMEHCGIEHNEFDIYRIYKID